MRFGDHASILEALGYSYWAMMMTMMMISDYLVMRDNSGAQSVLTSLVIM